MTSSEIAPASSSRSRAALTVTALAGPAFAATPGSTAPGAKLSFPGPGASANEKKLAYSRYCGAEGKRCNTRKAKDRRTCLGAMARLAGGKASSPSSACRALKRRHSKGRKASTAAYERCVKAGRRLQEDQKDQKAADEAAAELLPSSRPTRSRSRPKDRRSWKPRTPARWGPTRSSDRGA